MQRMLLMRLIGLTAVAVFALSGVTVASASAHEFIYSTTGALRGHALTKQVFRAEENGPAAECIKAESSGAIEAPLKWDTLSLSFMFKECVGPTGVGATVSEAAIILNANGTISIENTVTITVGTLCKITMPPLGPLSGVTYEDSGGKIVVNIDATGVRSTVEGGGGKCGAEGEHNNGTFKGSNEIELEGGEIEWR